MNRNRMENDRDPGIWNRNGRDDQQKRLIKELKVEINRSIVSVSTLQELDFFHDLFFVFKILHSLSVKFSF